MVTTPTMMPALLSPGGRSTGASRPESSRSYSTDEPPGPATSSLHLVGVDGPAAPRAQHLLLVVVDRLEHLRRGQPDGRRHAGAGLVVEPGRDGRDRPVRTGHPAVRADLLDAGAGGQRRDAVLQRVSCSTSASMTGHTCSQTWFMSRRAPLAPRAPARADRLEAVGDGSLHVGERGDPAGLVADDAELPDLGQRDEPLVGGVLRRDGEVEEHVLRRVQPGQGELPQPPQVEPAPDHRVDATDQVVFDDAAVLGRPEGEVGGGAALARPDGDRDPADPADDVELLHHLAQRRGGLLDVLGLASGQERYRSTTASWPGSPASTSRVTALTRRCRGPAR